MAHCGYTWVDEHFPIPRTPYEPYETNACVRCFVHPKPGKKVRYLAWARRPNSAVAADRRLVRGAIYTIQRVKKWQHGCNITLKEDPTNWLYDVILFTPMTYQPEEMEPSWDKPQV